MVRSVRPTTYARSPGRRAAPTRGRLREGSRMIDNNRLITVCSECLQASCWQGEFYCDDYKTAGTKRLTIRELRKLDREHESYWDAARIARIEGWTS